LNKSDEENNADQEKELDDYSIAENFEQGTCNLFWLHFGALTIKRLLVAFRQPKTFLLEILIPVVLIITGLALSNSPFFKNPPAVPLDLSIYPKNQKLFYSIAPGLDQTQVNLFKSAFSNSKWTNQTEISLSGSNLNDQLTNFDKFVYDTNKGYDDKLINSGNYILYNVNKATNTYHLIGLVNSYGRDTVPTYFQYMYQGALAVATGNPNFNFTTEVMAFPLTATAIAGAKAGSGSVVAFLFAIAFAMIPAGVVSQIVGERETNVKHQQFISGASLFSYWTSNYFVDWIRSMIAIVVAIAFVYIFAVDMPGAYVLFLLFVLAIHPFTYATSFFFKKENMAQTMTILMHVFVGGF